jgi:hypothetical protein
VLCALLTTLSAGCKGPPPLYDWGVYEEILWEAYRGESDPTSQLARLEADVERIDASGGRVPPGVHAHIGFLRFATGDRQAAREHFLRERELFPESTVFLNGVLARLEDSSERPAAPPGAPPAPSAEEPGDSRADEMNVEEARP